MPAGRPSDYSKDIAAEICERLADGNSLRSICRDDNMPDKGTVFRWLAAHEEFRDQYTCAREAQADTLFDEMLDIADDASKDVIEGAADPEHIQRTKLRIETRKWMAGKLRPKKYGDKIEHEHSGHLNHTVSKIELVGVTPE
ncbi:terminase small subunit protein [Sphingopyxis sp. JAI128]|uniref:terminase small subunit-like protein n=1 Tax=Sphingopyxis sp. JAI128 TaxID=2723066 RepID=UPI001615DC69|nr:terminase small subunit protein [Sphingopyxis sp. JAI128]MBB6424962.1 hypothetical protein [Sphingopyxis sp. JAI128]